MSGGQWREVVHRGEFTFEIVTRTRASQDGVDLPPGRDFYGVIVREGADPVLVSFENLFTVCAFVREMAPRELLLHTGAGENPVPLQRAINELRALPAETPLH